MSIFMFEKIILSSAIVQNSLPTPMIGSKKQSIERERKQFVILDSSVVNPDPDPDPNGSALILVDWIRIRNKESKSDPQKTMK
jgi:hypothetical protein